MGILSSYTRLSRPKKIAIIMGILILLYAIFGFLIAPPILKSKLIAGIAEHLGRNAAVKEIKLNPFVLSVTVRGFEMKEPGGKRFVGFEELYVNFQLSSIFRRAYTFDEIHLIAPDGQVKVLPDGRLNFSDLLASSDSQKPAQNQNKGLPPLLIFRLQVEQGRLAFSDLSRPTPFETSFFPIGITLNDFSTRKDSESPYAFNATTGEEELLSWEGNFSVNPLRSQGRFTLTNIKTRTLWKYIQDQVRFEVTSGSINLAGQYEMDAGGEAIHFEMVDGELQLSEFILAEKDGKSPLISMPLFSVKGTNVDLSKKQVVFGLVSSSDARFEGWLTPDGSFNYQSLFVMDSLEPDDEAASGISDQSEAESKPWLITVNELRLENYGAALEDRTLVKPVRISLEPINVNLKNLSNQKDSQTEVALALKVNQTGSVEAQGSACINPVSANLGIQVAQIALKPFQSYVDSVAQIDLVSGTLNLDGQAKYRRLGAEGPELRYKGRVSIDVFEADDRLHSDDFLKWKSLSLNGLVFDLEPTKLSISEIVAKQPYARVIIRPDKTINLSSAFSPQDDKSIKDAESEEQPPIPITIDSVRIENGSTNFADLALKPNFATGIQSLNGTIKGLSSESLTRADVLLEGKVDKYAPVKIAGQINPLSEDKYTDIALSFKNIELTTFTPYSGKFAGYTIKKGKLSLDLKYKLSKNVLIGENEIFLDQLTLGERVDSPDATTLPVSLAIALLKDREGRIDIDLPVRGDLNDPEFSYGRIVLRALVNLITKIVTSPFAALGGLIGGDGEELSFVEFEFGRAALGDEQVKKLDKLAKALYERPALKLEIKGTADKQSDRLALAEAELLNQLKRTRLEELRTSGKPVPTGADDIALSDDDYARLVIQVYMERFGEHPKALFTKESEESAKDKGASSEADQSLPGTAAKPLGPQPIDRGVLIAAAKQQLIENIPVDESSLRQLAQERAKQIKGHLVEKGEIPDERVFIVEVEISPASEGETMRTNLMLSGT